MLEALGAQTEFSCEGHPDGFYIVFYAPISLAQSLVYCGFFRVELEGRTNGTGDIYRWSVRLGSHMATESEKEKVLNWAAEAWARFFNKVTI